METMMSIVAVVAIKLTAMIAGYKIVALGHDTLVKGIKGEFDFSGDAGQNNRVTLKSTSPGLLFVLLGSLLIGWSIFVDKPITYHEGTKTTALEPARTVISPQPMREDSK